MKEVDEINMSVVGGGKYDESFPVLKQVGRISRREKSAAYWNSTKLKLPAEAAIAAAAEVVKPYYLRRKTRLIKSFHIDDNGELVIEDDDDDQEESLQKSSSSSSPSEEDNVNVGGDIHMMKSSDDDDVDKLMAQNTTAAPAPAPAPAHEEDQLNQQQEKDDDDGCDEQEEEMMKSEDNVEEYLNESAGKAGVDVDLCLSCMQVKFLLQMSPTQDGEGETTTQEISTSAAPLKQDHSTDQLFDQPHESGDQYHEVQTETETEATPLQERESTTATDDDDDDDDEKVSGDSGDQNNDHEAHYFFFGTIPIPIPIPRPKLIPTQTLIAAPDDDDDDPKMNEEEREAAFVVDQASELHDHLVGEREAVAFVDEELQNSSVEEHGTSSDNNQTETAAELIKSSTDEDQLHPTAALKQVIKVETQVQVQVQKKKEKEEAEEEISFGGNNYDHHFPKIDITNLKFTKRELKMRIKFSS